MQPVLVLFNCLSLTSWLCEVLRWEEQQCHSELVLEALCSQEVDMLRLLKLVTLIPVVEVNCIERSRRNNNYFRCQNTGQLYVFLCHKQNYYSYFSSYIFHILNTDSVTMHCILYISYYNFHIGILKKNISVAGILRS